MTPKNDEQTQDKQQTNKRTQYCASRGQTPPPVRTCSRGDYSLIIPCRVQIPESTPGVIAFGGVSSPGGAASFQFNPIYLFSVEAGDTSVYLLLAIQIIRSFRRGRGPSRPGLAQNRCTHDEPPPPPPTGYTPRCCKIIFNVTIRTWLPKVAVRFL